MATTTGSATANMVFRNTSTRLGRHISMTPANSAMRHLFHGRIMLDAAVPSANVQTGTQETGLIVLSGSANIEVEERQFPLAAHDGIYIPRDSAVRVSTGDSADIIEFLWAMAAHREREDRQFGVANVQPEFAGVGSGLEASRK
jgi:hypothetical protein